MALIVGTRLGPYEILSLIGEGGMGEVYQARDTRLNRTVAVKTLTQQISNSSELKKRTVERSRDGARMGRNCST
jgi:serine/threonine protein kinase